MNPQQIVEKYSTNIPRYTSYPTVPDWQNNIDFSNWNDEFAKYTNQEISLYIHIPFCNKLCTFCACNKLVTKNYDNISRYINALENEILLYSHHEKIKVQQFHIGGGTPTFLRPEDMNTLFQMLDKYFIFNKEAEKSIEAHPEFTTEEQIKTLAKWNFNRISFGIQDFNPEVQKIINRVQDYENILHLTNFAREQGFESINYDFVYGLPLQNGKCIDTIIAGVHKAKPDRIAFYGYAHVPWKGIMQRNFSIADLPTPQERLKLFIQGKAGFESLEYHPIGFDHFALPADDLAISYQNGTIHRNFMGYTVKRSQALLGLGVSAISETPNAYKQNTKNLAKYYKNQTLIETSHLSSEVELHAKKQIMELLTKFETATEITPALEIFASDGLLEYQNGRIIITEIGKMFARNIAAEFDPHRKEKENKRFSQSV